MTPDTHPNRRQVLRNAAALGLFGTLTPHAVAGADDSIDSDDSQKNDRDFVMAAGLTAEEADCWKAAAEAAGLFFALPKLHPMDRQEVATAIHVLQNKLLSRPTYREYLKHAKAARK